MDIIKFKNNYRINNHAVSAVIGVILMVAITVAIAATVYVYVSGMMGEVLVNTPSISLIAEPSEDKQEVIFTILTITDTGLNWNDISGTLVNISSATEINITDLSWRPNGEISGGDIFTIKNVIDISNSNQYLQSDFEYRLSITYNPTGGTMGSIKWIH
jgi:FlaG/FlaF family flagellin (archaellin)